MKKQIDMLHGNIIYSLIAFSIPLFISNLFQVLYNAADTMIVGNQLGDKSLAAIGACTAVYDLLVGFALGIGNGMSIVVARAYGAQDMKRVKRSVAGASIIGVIVTIVVMILAKFSLYPILKLLKTDQEIIGESYTYIIIITMAVGVMFTYNLLSGFLNAIGNSLAPLVFLIFSAIINVILDLLFIVGFSMGVEGAAYATIIAQMISAILCFIYIVKRCPMLLPAKEDFKIQKSLYIELFSQGISMGIMLAIVSAGTVILQIGINELDNYLILSGHTVARKLSSICMMPIGTISLATSTFVSQNFGANNRERILKAIRYAIIFSFGWAIIISTILFLFSPWIVRVMSGSTKDIVIRNGSNYLKINAPFYSALGVLLVLRSSLQGIGKKVIPVISSVIELLGKIVFILFFIPSLKYFGVIICEPVIWCLMCVQLVFSFYTNPFIRGKKSKEF